MSQRENNKAKQNNKEGEKENKEPNEAQILSSLNHFFATVLRVPDELEQKPSNSKSFANSEQNASINNPPRPMFSNGPVLQCVNNLEERKYIRYKESNGIGERALVIKRFVRPRIVTPILRNRRIPRVSTRHVFKMPKIYVCQYCGKIEYHIARLMTHMRNDRLRYLRRDDSIPLPIRILIKKTCTKHLL